MTFPEFGVKRPVTNLMIFCVILILAFYSLTKIGVDFFPEIEPPVISVISSYPGANPEDVESKVTQVLEDQLSTTPGVEKITSYSSEGTSFVQLKFIWGTDLDAASNDIRDRIELAKRFLPDIPDEMENPFIYKFNTSNIPIIFLGITARQSYPGLYDLIDKRVGDSLRQLPGVGTVQFQGGGLERQINIWVDRQRLEGYGFSILDIQKVLARENITQPVGNLKSGLTDYLIRLPGEFSSPEEINTVILGMRGGTPVYLRDVARVDDGFKEVTSIVRVNGETALIMMVQKQSGTNTVEVSRQVKARLRELVKTLPADVKIVTIFDTSSDIINSLNSLKSTLWSGIFLVLLVVWFFLREFAASAIIALTIPFSLLISFVYLFLSGKTINTISLSSLAITSGMVVDNAIVIVDNIYRRLERRQRPSEAAIFGASEMTLAVGASTLTTIVVFVPLLFVKGVVGIIFGQLAAIVIVTLAASLFTSLTFSPMLCSRWLRVGGPGSRQGMLGRLYAFSERIFKGWEEGYSRSLGWCLAHRKFVIMGFLGVFTASLFLGKFIGTEFIPAEDSGDVRLTVYLPIGTRLEETDKAASRIEEILTKEVPEATYCFVRSGTIPGLGRAFGNVSGTHIVTAGIKLVPKSRRSRSSEDVAQLVRKRIRQIPGVWRTDITTGNPIGRIISGGAGKGIQIEILGDSFEETGAVAEKIKAVMARTPGTVDVSISREANRPEIAIQIDRVRASALGLNMRTIGESIKASIQGTIATKYRERGETYDVYVRFEDFSRSRIEDLENLPLSVSAAAPEKGGRSIKLSQVARIYETAVPEDIERKNRQRVIRVECNAYQRSSGTIVEELQRQIAAIILPAGVSVNFGGEAEEQKKAFQDLFLLLILGIILVYMVMAAQFESLLSPFVVMFSIPFTFIGVILGFLITGITLSVVSFLGVVMLMGIVVNNAIVLISYINILRQRGVAMVEAVREAGRNRLRPVLMTTMTTLGGLLPLALAQGEGSESWRPLGVSMIGGLTVSTIVTMLLVPTIYAVFESRLRRARGDRKGGARL